VAAGISIARDFDRFSDGRRRSTTLSWRRVPEGDTFAI
jgi:hypothetical protein